MKSNEETIEYCHNMHGTCNMTLNITCFPPFPTALAATHFFISYRGMMVHASSPNRRGPSVFDDWRFQFLQTVSSDSEHQPMFTCFFVGADILNALCRVSKKKPTSFNRS